MTTPLSAPKSILMGPPGSGKTYSIVTLLQLGLDVFVIVTEPNGVDALLDACRRTNTPTDNLHWHYVSPVKISTNSLLNLARTINTNTFEAIANMKNGIEKTSTTNVMDFLHQLENFRDDRTGLAFGSPFDWSYDRVLVVDSLSGLNNLVMQNAVGLKPNPSPGEWNIAMSFEENIINKLVSDLICYLVLICHIDRNTNEATGGMIVTPAALGSKLGPRIGRYFGDVILTRRAAGSTGFQWSTLEGFTDVKNRSLPIQSDLAPTFSPIVAAFNARVKQLETTLPLPSPPPKETPNADATNAKS